MTDHNPSLRFPGEYEPRDRPPSRLTETREGSARSSTIAPGRPTGTVASPPRLRRSAERRLWVRVSLFLGVLFAAMFVAMWGASIIGE